MKYQIYYLLFLTTVILFGCSSSDSETLIEEEDTSILYFPSVNSDIWETTEIIDLNWNTTAIQPLYDLLQAKGTKAFIILKDGKIVVEQYFNGANAEDYNAWNSAGKTLSAFMMGIAQEEGHLSINKTHHLII
jgi:hypothetical protein